MLAPRRPVIEASLVAATLSGAPSTIHALIAGRSLSGTLAYVADATRAVGTLVPPGRPGLVRGAVVHLGISVVCAGAEARILPAQRPVAWGAGAGAVLGVVNIGLIGRAFPAIAALPTMPQIADNIMFGAVVAAVLARRGHDFKPNSTV
jgi:hypothetical protein